MIVPPLGQVKMGMMRRVRLAKGVDVIPEISPDIQGSRAYSLLTEEQKGMLKYALADAAVLYKCSVNDLEWSFGKTTNGVAPLKVKPRRRIEIHKCNN